MVCCLRFFVAVGVPVVIGCGKSAPPPLQPEPLEPLFSTNTVCYESYTFELHRFGDSARSAEADTSYLVIHGLADTLVGNTSGSAWVMLGANGWGPSKSRWRRIPGDSVEVAVRGDSIRQEYHLALFEEAAKGVGLEYEKTLNKDDGPATDEWDMVLSRIHCSGMREPQDPPVRKPKKPGLDRELNP